MVYIQQKYYDKEALEGYENETQHAEFLYDDESSSLVAEGYSLCKLEIPYCRELRYLNNASWKEETSVYRWPLYAYMHSGTVLSMHPFSCPWDSGVVGFIHVSKESLKEFGMEDCTKEEVRSWVRDEIENVNRYLMGSVYKVLIYNNEGDVTDVSLGYYDLESCRDFLKENTNLNPETDKIK